jgi:serine/threonine-protein kinase
VNTAADSFTGTFTGAILRGKYRLGPSIGRGGMGEVFEATQLATGAAVAIKVVSRHLGGDMTMARLQREAEAARRVQSEFIPRLYDIDSTADGELFLVMERLHGETLAERLRRREGNLSWEETRVIGEHILRGLVDAHAAGVVHRDLKPGNIFIECASPDTGGIERTRILDFGVCKLDAHDGESLTSTGEAVGTISYMAPEQIRGAAHVDERADIYSFAMVIFEALSGRLAHDASGQIAMIASKLERPARHLRDAALVSYPSGLDELLARCLSRRLEERIATATELLRAWRMLGRPIVAPTPHASFAPMPEPSQTDTGMTSHSARHVSTRSTRLGVVLAACAFAVSCVVLAVALVVRAPAEARPVPAIVWSAPLPSADSTPATTALPPPSDDAPGVDPASLPVAAPDDPDAAAPPPRGKAHRHGNPRSSSGGAPPAATVPQIAVKPRY